MTALLDRNAGVRASAAAALGAIGKPAQDAIPILVERLSDPDKTVRYQAGAALGRIEDKPRATGKRVHLAYESEPKEVMERAVQAYVGLDPDKKPDIKVKQMFDALEWGDAENRGTAALLLAGWGPLNDSAKDTLREARWSEDDNDVRWCMRLATDIQGPKVDDRVRTALNERDVKYSITDFGNFRAVFNTAGGRDQVAFINSNTIRYRQLEIREIRATGFEFSNGLSAEIANKLLKNNWVLKWGAWTVTGNQAVFVVKVAADAEALWSALLHATTVADEMEKEITGADKY